jgi:hypothetical protein
MSRRSEWREVRKAIVGGKGSVGKTVEEREKIPEKACGVCKNFSENAYSSDGRGSCGVLKFGSDLNADPPIFITEGETGLISFFNTDGGQCPHFVRMAFIDTDASETADPAFRRAQRQMEKVK